MAVEEEAEGPDLEEGLWAVVTALLKNAGISLRPPRESERCAGLAAAAPAEEVPVVAGAAAGFAGKAALAARRRGWDLGITASSVTAAEEGGRSLDISTSTAASGTASFTGAGDDEGGVVDR